MSEQNALTLKSIKDLLINHSFFIPSYQRGYKWDERQVKDLLEDISEFSQNKTLDNEFYCLQPIVVHKDGQTRQYRIIDGQQRLTTIYIILKYFQTAANKFDELKNKITDNEELKEILEFCLDETIVIPNLYTIQYDTRNKDKHNSKDFLEKKISACISYENSDFYYMSNAYKIIQEWFKGKNKTTFLNTLLNNVKVIWYEVSAKDEPDEIAIFSRLNVGKIPLTNAELIKAMLLLPIKYYKEQIEFSTTWDAIELALQNDEFWYFISNDKKSETAIDIVFDLLARQYQKDCKLALKNDDKFSFYVFTHVLKSNQKNAKDIWQEAQQYFRYLIDWFSDREIYHKVGYLVNFQDNLLELINEYDKKTKDIFKKCLENKITKTLKKNDSIVALSSLSYGSSYVNKVLLLFNIETILSNETSNIKFQFNAYKNNNWDIEHIASQTGKDTDINNSTDRSEWVKLVLQYYFGMSEKRLNEKTNKFSKEECFDKFQEQMKKKMNISTASDDNIGNLTLLDSKTNRGYGNSYFPIKRAIIIEKDSNGTFIPIATKNVFLKQYSKKLSNMMSWNESDMKAYRKEIANKLAKYGVKDDEYE